MTKPSPLPDKDFDEVFGKQTYDLIKAHIEWIENVLGLEEISSTSFAITKTMWLRGSSSLGGKNGVAMVLDTPRSAEPPTRIIALANDASHSITTSSNWTRINSNLYVYHFGADQKEAIIDGRTFGCIELMGSMMFGCEVAARLNALGMRFMRYPANWRDFVMPPFYALCRGALAKIFKHGILFVGRPRACVNAIVLGKRRHEYK